MTMRLVKGGLAQAARVARGGAAAWLSLCMLMMAGQALAQQAATAPAANAIEKVEQDRKSVV